jgi:hypothetical protein
MLDTSKLLDSVSKILPISALTGVFGYFVHAFQTARGKKRMREQLYREISGNYQRMVVQISLVTSIPGISQGAPFHFAEKLDLSFSVWNFYHDEKRRDKFFELSEAEAITRIYLKLSEIGMKTMRGYAHVRAKEAAAEIDDYLLNQTLDRKLYKKVSTADAWRFMDDLLNGRRKSHRAFLNPL